MNAGYNAIASSPEEEFANMTCKNNNWMHYGSTFVDEKWYLSPYVYPDHAGHVWVEYGAGFASDDSAAGPFSVFPTIYLKTNVLIESGTGTSSNPYTLKLSN